ncbi:glycogen debranching protein GlgX [Georgenia sp. Z1344]|uniref:glycogen debranching protein GlgX n=1 Tax=Georgenia sp. Z1344 TaxID=3416706 RepID=UPI003CED7945
MHSPPTADRAPAPRLYEDAGASPAPSPASRPDRRGVHLVGDGVDVAVFASRATRVDLCLVDVASDGGLSERRYTLRGPVHGVWHGHVPGVRAGQRYGFRVHGPWSPPRGQRHNPAKLLLDPYARAVVGAPRLTPALYAHVVGEDLVPVDGTGSPDPRDSVADAAHGVVVDDRFDGAVPAPRTPWRDTVIYEAHVRGLTMHLPGVPEHLRGTYAGLAHPATIAHLRSLGITAIELLPIHAKMDEPHLTAKGLTNYWGYNTLGYLAPEPSYASPAARAAGPAAVLAEVKGMVALLHAAGIEVLLDVVYNHTCEGGVAGPTVSWRGLGASDYYLHDDADRGRMLDTTGCGNTLDMRRTEVVRLVLDSLRYWVREVGIDGFRYDLAVTLGRNADQFTPYHPLLVALATDPVLREVKHIAEPWDLGPDGWRTGQFAAPVAEWNDRFRDSVRSFWLADPGAAAKGGTGRDLRDLATRLSGSADMFGYGDVPGGRGPLASISYVTAHDGFTLADLVAYEHKDNSANLEDNRDGTTDNLSWNHGAEGPVPGDSPAADVLPLRRRSIRNLLGTLLLSPGTPMLTAGDEIGRTQRGNNNTYCQDNELSYLDWDLGRWREDLLATARYLLRLRREHPVLRPERFYTGRATDGDPVPDLAWLGADATEMGAHRWHDPRARVLQMLRSGGGRDADVLLVLSSSLDYESVRLPVGRGADYELAWSSGWEAPSFAEAEEDSDPWSLTAAPGEVVRLDPLSMRVYVTRPASAPLLR